MSRALVLVAALLALAGCGKVTEVREPDVLAGEGIKPAPAAVDERAPRSESSIRLAVVTHGEASSGFWAIVKNGVDAAARQMNVSVSYRSPDAFNVESMRALISQAVDSRPDGLVVSIPDPAIGPAIRRARRAGVPVVSINSGVEVWRGLGVLSHVGQREEPAGRAAGRRLADAGVRRALCVVHEEQNQGLEQRCAGFARSIRRAGGTTRAVFIDVQNRQAAGPKVGAAIEREKADGVLTLGGDAAVAALDAKREGGRATKAKLATFDLSPEVLEAVKDGRILFAVDQQAYLQGYMPIVMLTQQARYGLFPSLGEVVPTGPNFVTEETADLALQTSARGIR